MNCWAGAGTATRGGGAGDKICVAVVGEVASGDPGGPDSSGVDSPEPDGWTV